MTTTPIAAIMFAAAITASPSISFVSQSKECGHIAQRDGPNKYVWHGIIVQEDIFLEHVGRWFMGGERDDCSEWHSGAPRRPVHFP